MVDIHQWTSTIKVHWIYVLRFWNVTLAFHSEFLICNQERCCWTGLCYRRFWHPYIHIRVFPSFSEYCINLKKYQYWSSVFQNAILQWCCPVDSVRAIRLAFRFGTGVGHINEVLQDLPDECRLDGSIPRSLEYVLWENDWGGKLYTVERGSDSVPKIAYSGLERLPGRFSNSNLTWSNDSIIDHMDTSEPRLGDDQLS